MQSGGSLTYLNVSLPPGSHGVEQFLCFLQGPSLASGHHHYSAAPPSKKAISRDLLLRKHALALWNTQLLNFQSVSWQARMSPALTLPSRWRPSVGIRHQCLFPDGQQGGRLLYQPSRVLQISWSAVDVGTSSFPGTQVLGPSVCLLRARKQKHLGRCTVLGTNIV